MFLVLSNDVKQLTGKGMEILTDKEGNPIAEFFNGNFVQALQSPNAEEPTLKAVA